MWNPEEFVLPTLHAALQTDDEIKLDVATEAWEEASVAYQKYLNGIEWPEWLKTFIFGEPQTGINSSDKLHDAELSEFWEVNNKLIMVFSTRNCPWDGRKAVVVIEYQLASPVVFSEDQLDLVSQFAYDQFSSLGSDIYRHYIMFNSHNVQIDFTFLKVTRFEF